MTFSDYIWEVKHDAIEAIERGDYDYCDDAECVYDDMWTDDSITGNGSGSYTFSTAEAEENTRGLMWDEDFAFEERQEELATA